MVVEIGTTIEVQIRECFQNAQNNTAGHRKLIHVLRRLHMESATSSGSEGERDFFLALIHCLNVLLAVKRGEEVVSRCLRFLVGFIVVSAERDEARVLGGSTATTRLIENIMLYALEGIDSKERLVRARLGQLLVACVNAVDEVSDQVWTIFREKLTERLFDREAAVRIQAVHSMARLQGLPLTDGKKGGGGGGGGGGLLVRDVFLELLVHDPSADVRKAVLTHIDVTEETLQIILERRRDLDPGVRRHFYSHKMQNEVDVRILSISQRDAVLRAGLRDRDAGVRRACIEMVFGKWIQTANNNLIQLLFALDVLRHTPVAESALRAFFEVNNEMFTTVLPDSYFENLTPETALALRVYCEYVGLDRTVDLLPEMSVLAGHVRRLYESMLSSTKEEEEGGSTEQDLDEHRVEIEFMLVELFRMINLLDKADEMGRHVVQRLLTEMMGNLELGDVVFTQALKLLTSLSPNLENFLSSVGQLLVDLYELYSSREGSTGLEEHLQKSLESLCLIDGTVSPLSEDARILAQLRCLEIVGAALQLPEVSLVQCPTLLELVNDAVIPAINSHYAAVQTKGLLCLGLACILSRDLCIEYIDLLVEFFQHGQDDTRLTALKILFDIVFCFGRPPCEGEGGEAALRIITVLEKIIPALHDEDIEIQAIAAEGYAKLLLHRIISNVQVVIGLLQLYFHPATVKNARLRQALTYFFQAFAYSSAHNQALLAHAALPLLEFISRPGGGAAAPLSISISQVSAQLLELTDPERLLDKAERVEGLHAHAIIAEELAWAALGAVSESKGKLYAQLLTKLRIDNSWPGRTLKRLLFITGQLMRIVSDKTVLTGLKKMVASLVEFDDPTQLLEPEDLIDLRARRAALFLPEARNNNPPLTTTTGAKSRALRTLKPLEMSTTNIMDEIGDLLED